MPSAVSAASRKVHPPSPREHNWLIGRHRAWAVILAALAMFGVLSWSITQLRKAFWPCFGGLLAVAIVYGVALCDSTRPDGEPLELFAGISIWTPTAIRLIACLLAAGLMYRAWQDVEKAGDYARLALPERDLADLKASPITKKALFREFFLASWSDVPEDGKSLFRKYRDLGSQSRRLTRTFKLTFIYLLFGGSLMYLMGGSMSQISARGDWARWIAVGVLLPAVITMVALTFYSYDAVEHCRRFVKHVASSQPNWSSDAPGMRELIDKRNPLAHDDARELLTIELLGKQTQAVGYLVTYPFYSLILLILSRHPSFEYFAFPFALLALWILPFLGAILFTIGLRWTAGQARAKILDRLRERLSSVLPQQETISERRADQLRHFIADIQREKRGAFKPLMQEPFIYCLATLLGGTSGILLVQQFLPYK